MWRSKAAVSAWRPLPTLNATFPPAPHYCRSSWEADEQSGGIAARRGKKEKFTSLLHHIDPEMLRTAFHAIKRDAAPGVDGMTWETYEQDLDRRIEIL